MENLILMVIALFIILLLIEMSAIQEILKLRADVNFIKDAKAEQIVKDLVSEFIKTRKKDNENERT